MVASVPHLATVLVFQASQDHSVKMTLMNAAKNNCVVVIISLYVPILLEGISAAVVKVTNGTMQPRIVKVCSSLYMYFLSKFSCSFANYVSMINHYYCYY